MLVFFWEESADGSRVFQIRRRYAPENCYLCRKQEKNQSRIVNEYQLSQPKIDNLSGFARGIARCKDMDRCVSLYIPSAKSLITLIVSIRPI